MTRLFAYGFWTLIGAFFGAVGYATAKKSQEEEVKPS